MPWRRQKKPLEKKNEDCKKKADEKALTIRNEMVKIFDDLKHNPHDLDLLNQFHEKCQEFNEFLKEVNQQYENTHNSLGLFRTKN